MAEKLQVTSDSHARKPRDDVQRMPFRQGRIGVGSTVLEDALLLCGRLGVRQLHLLEPPNLLLHLEHLLVSVELDAAETSHLERARQDLKNMLQVER